MRGRDRFHKFKTVLDIVIRILRLFPRPALKYAWTLTDLLPDTAGVAMRYCLLKCLTLSCGDNVFVGRSVEIKYWERLRIGSNVSIHKQCYLDACGEIQIDDEVSIAHQSSLISFQHSWEDESLPIRDNPVVCSKIHIHRDVWIGCGCRVLAGASIGSRSIVAAGAVVTRPVPSMTVAAGVPAKIIKSIRKEGHYERSVGT
ncbi:MULTISPECIES: acyltransferase [unclassified Paenibacillus]|uniref:acyltransferase n=1 Tax=unclassified Paenibacillus TaxID=185978 RepID=UPI00020D689C|nr:MULTISPECIES: acyltransferase [unclassified Paenibacillus]EGL16545.1 bacterial transferase hexapeptide repeat protein [Paenibacillus sp. HGF7]